MVEPVLVVHIVSPLVRPHSPTSYSTSANSTVELVAESSPFCVPHHHPQYHWSKFLLESWSDNCNFCSCGLGAALLGPMIVALTIMPPIAAQLGLSLVDGGLCWYLWREQFGGRSRFKAGADRLRDGDSGTEYWTIGRVGMISLVRP